MSFGITASSAVTGSGGVANSIYTAAVLQDSPLIYLQFEETTGSMAADSSGNGHDATYVNSPTLGRYSVISGDGKSVLFNNVSTSTKSTAIVPYGSWMNTPAMTIALAAIIVPQGLQILASRYNEPGSDWSWFLYVNNNRFYFFYQADSGQTVSIDSGVTITQGKRYYVTAYAGISGCGIRVYDETGLIGSATGAGYTVKSSSRALVLADAESAGYDITAYMDELSIYDSVLPTSRLDTLASIAMQFRPKWINRSAGVSSRNGTTTHTVSFPAANAGSLLVAVINSPGISSAISAGWTERLTQATTSETAVYTRSANAGDSQLILSESASNLPINYVIYEFPSGSAWYTGASQHLALPTLSGLPGTPLVLIGAFGQNISAAAGHPDPASYNATWQYFCYKDVDSFVDYDGVTDGTYLSVGYFNDFVDTTANLESPAVQYIIPPAAGNTESVLFALSVPN